MQVGYKKAPDHLKSSAQGMITFATYGLGMFIGTWIAGKSVDILTFDGVKDWSNIWLIPAAISFAGVILFIFLFKENNGKAKSIVK